MMITKETKQVFRIGEREFGSIAEAKEAALTELLVSSTNVDSIALIQRIIEHSEAVVDILTTTPNSLPKARRIHGGKKPRKPKAPVVDVVTAQTPVITGQLSGTAKPTEALGFVKSGPVFCPIDK